MDRVDTASRPSGIPRASKLPVLSKRSSQLFIPAQDEPPTTTPAISRLAKRSSIASLPRPTSAVPQRPNGVPARPTRPQTSIRSASAKSSSSNLALTNRDDDGGDQLSSLDSFRASSRQSSYDEHDNGVRNLPATKVRKSRPSLSDRAMESIHAVPTTPKDRRQSNFFVADSPMASTHRPGSVLSNTTSTTSRPGTSDGTFVKPAPPTAIKMPMSAKPLSRVPSNGFGFSQSGRRTTSLTAKLQSAREVQPVRHPETAPADAKLSTIRHTVTEPSEAKSVASSSALRQQIAAAKAAAKKVRENPIDASPWEPESSTFGDVDPFNQVPKDGKHVLRNRIRTARLDGKLNIAALQLKEIPEEVMTMYSSASIEDSKISWAELVDLTKFIAADNELEMIDDKVFPDLTMEELQDEAHGKDGQFGGIEVLDLHSNLLSSVPLGLRRLERLTSLSLTHNRLDNSSLDTISQIKTLRELRIGHNSISGNLPSAICSLSYLEVLDLQANRLLALPEAIRELTHLRVLNVSANQLTSLPMDAIAHIPLHELDASSNALIASLFPLGGVSQHRSLRSLNLANNSLAALTFSQELDMPELQTLDVTNNHLTLLPPVSGWQKLTTLTAGDNKIAELPAGFAQLKHLRIANLTGNELYVLPPEIALMESLTTLVLASNPLRHKKYLTMDAAGIKQDLRAFLDQIPEDYDDEVASWGTAPEDPSFVSGWTLKPGGILDLSNRGLTDSVNDTLGSFLKANEVRQLNLQGNKLTTIPPALWLGHNLRSLDLSNNPLEVDYLTDELELPALIELAVANCRITRLSPLIHHLRAPELHSLQIHGNRLSGAVPDLHEEYPQLMTLLAADNKFESVSADALRGYSTVDLTSNELQSLPAEIGLLWEEGLKSFEVGRNAFRVPGHRVLEKGTQATMRWLKDRIKITTDEMDAE
ncbi:hypothetical protein AMS68_000444 [Peltaster fructicola]|uniref:L domain-like protein n=1 Tax=Peltaster fructicola TaxID=286661 RepID=A0A6H0XJL8_9PEZI|nr:hypothetical protein AMS68_000444 [Peltaster fructicola]